LARRKLSSLYDEFYSRQIVLKELGKQGQRKLAEGKVAVVGLGGLGTVSSLYLALAGVGYLRLIDQDVVEVRNLHRQILYRLGDVHYPKVEVAAERLGKKNPLVKVEAVPENVNEKNVVKLLSGVDCVVDGLDNMGTRYLVNRACVKLGVPYVFGAAIGIEGTLSVFASPETPCLECLYPSVDDRELDSCDVRGVLGATAGVIGSLQALEIVKVLAGVGSVLKGKLMVCDFSDMYFASVDILKREDCPACRGGFGGLKAGERVVWLCGRDTANVNPEKPLKLSLNKAYGLIKEQFRVRLKSHLAVIFDYKSMEITLFNGGRMIIKNVKSEKSALAAYREVLRKLSMD
jgi:adenylyltransferase/sulfurtransferase